MTRKNFTQSTHERFAKLFDKKTSEQMTYFFDDLFKGRIDEEKKVDFFNSILTGSVEDYEKELEIYKAQRKPKTFSEKTKKERACKAIEKQIKNAFGNDVKMSKEEFFKWLVDEQ